MRFSVGLDQIQILGMQNSFDMNWNAWKSARFFTHIINIYTDVEVQSNHDTYTKLFAIQFHFSSLLILHWP